MLIGSPLFNTPDRIFTLEVEPYHLESLSLFLIIFPEIICLLDQIVIKHVLGRMLLNKLLILSVFLRVTEEVASVSDGLCLVVRALPIVLLVGEYLLRHLVHLFLLCNRLELGLLFFHEFKDVPLHFHLLELLGVLEFQVGLHQSQTNK